MKPFSSCHSSGVSSILSTHRIDWFPFAIEAASRAYRSELSTYILIFPLSFYFLCFCLDYPLSNSGLSWMFPTISILSLSGTPSITLGYKRCPSQLKHQPLMRIGLLSCRKPFNGFSVRLSFAHSTTKWRMDPSGIVRRKISPSKILLPFLNLCYSYPFLKFWSCLPSIGQNSPTGAAPSFNPKPQHWTSKQLLPEAGL